MARSGSIGRYFEGTKRYSTRRLILEMALIPFPFKFALGALYGALGGEMIETNTEIMAESGILAVIFGALLVAPLIETLIGQWLPIWFLSFFTSNALRLVLFSALVFSLLHLGFGILAVLATLPVGIFLSWCFLVGRQRSRWRAYWTTEAAHAIHNAIAFLIFSFG